METKERPFEATLERFIDAVFSLLMDGHHSQASELSLTLPQAQALRVVAHGPVSTSELARRLLISAPAVTQLVDRLTRKRLIDRRPVPGDRRSTTICLSHVGIQVIDGFRQRRNKAFAAALTRLASAERTQIIDSLDKLANSLEALHGPTPVPMRHEPPPAEPRSKARRLPLRQASGQTAVPEPPASNQAAQTGLGLRRRKMRMEWD